MKTKLLLSAALLLAISPLPAQQKRTSPRETVTRQVEGATITIVYSRPFTKDPKTGETRKIWGALVPFGKVWRTGADEATTLASDKDLEIGGTAVPAGTYSLFTIPEENGARLIINKQTGQWGTRYDESQDFARIDLKKQATREPVEQFTIAVEQNEDKDGELRLLWENVSYSTIFSVKP
jgi:hypothetical protein